MGNLQLEIQPAILRLHRIFFSGENRDQFREGLDLDQDTWVRALEWTLWKTLCWPIEGTDTKRILLDVYSDYQKRYT